MTRVKRESTERFYCPSCGYAWHVEGRFNADGAFEPFDDDTYCPECGSDTYAADDELRVAE